MPGKPQLARLSFVFLLTGYTGTEQSSQMTAGPEAKLFPNEISSILDQALDTQVSRNDALVYNRLPARLAFTHGYADVPQD